MHTIIGLVIMFGFWLFPEYATITALGWRVLGLFIGTVYLWAMVDAVWPSFLAVVMYVVTGYTTVANAFSSAFGTTIFWMMICIMAMFAVMNETGLGERLTANLLTLGFLQGHPWRFTAFFFVVECLLANAVGGLATVFLLWSILALIRKFCDLEKGNSYLHLMGIGVALFGAGSECLLPFKNAMLLGMIGMCGPSVGEVNYVRFMIGAVPIWIGLLAGYLLLMKCVFHCDVAFLKNLDISGFKKELGPMKRSEKLMSAILLLWLIVLTVGSCVPARSALGIVFARLGGIYGATILFFVIASILYADEKPLASFQRVAGNIPWGMVLMIAVAMSIGTPLMSDDCGIKAVLVAFLTTVLGGHSALIFVAIAILAAVVLTNVSNNMVIAFMLCPIFIAVNEVQPIPVMACLGLLTFAANFAIVLPSASPVAAMLFGNEELVNKSRHFGYSIPIALMGYIVLMVIGYPVYSLILG